MTTPTQQLSDAGVSIWLDDLSRGRLDSGTLRKLIEEKNVVGVTTNPSIFHAAITTGHDYDAIIEAKAAAGATVEETVFAITTTDVADACDLFAPVAAATNGVDGRVSIEVDPRLAWDTAGTIAEAKTLHGQVNKDNVLIKIPATLEGLEAITATLAAGISVNVTLIFSLERYRAVINAFQSGLEQAKDNGHDLSKIHSVASFFVSRVDAEIEKRLDAIGTDEAAALKGKAGLANAGLAYQASPGTLLHRTLGPARRRRCPPVVPALGLHRRERARLPGDPRRHQTDRRRCRGLPVGKNPRRDLRRWTVTVTRSPAATRTRTSPSTSLMAWYQHNDVVAVLEIRRPRQIRRLLERTPTDVETALTAARKDAELSWQPSATMSPVQPVRSMTTCFSGWNMESLDAHLFAKDATLWEPRRLRLLSGSDG